MTKRICPFCPAEIKEDGMLRGACELHLKEFMAAKREKMKVTDFQSAYYQQRRRYKAPLNTSGGEVTCKYCKQTFIRTGNEVFCAGTRCRENWLLENPVNNDYSVVIQGELEDFYYIKDMSIKDITLWYQKNKGLSISTDTVRRLMAGFGITYEKKVAQQLKKVK